MPSGAELFVQSIKELGINRIVTLVGDHLNEALAVAARHGLEILDMRHESGVTHAADAWGRLSRKPAISLVTGGPGHTNSLTGIATANLAASPLIAVSGSRASAAAGRGAFQDIDQVGMAKPVAKWAAEVPAAAQIPFYMGKAYQEANTGRKGAVHLTIPVDLFLAKTDAPAALPQPVDEGAPAPGSREIERAMSLLRAAQRPVIIAGSGVWWADAAQELRQFVERTSLPLYTITMAKGVVSDEHPLCMGYADPALNQAVHAAFKEADLFLVLGKRFDYRLALGGPRLFGPAAKFIQVDIHAPELGMNRRLEVGIWADVKSTLRALLAEAGEKAWTPLPWIDRLRQLRRDWEAKLAEAAQDRGSEMHPAAFYAELKKWLPQDVYYAWDGGDVVHWGRATLPALHPGRWVRLGPLGTIGSALPNSLAMQWANPGKPVVLITGDGSLGFYIAEMDTAVRHKLPVVMIVGNDAGWGLERELQGATAGSTVACELRRTRYDEVMRGFGGGGETVDRLDQVRPAVERAFSSGIPYCLNVNVRGVRSPFTQWQLSGKK
ncbi:MAG TPA: thiamine pyrophosphate-binding protein [Bryobacteraceae bacterium]|jgi:acetolactate synthase-1/2/3 large subunit|nr:thiamine pyrophosphate-binding protein [Bryobacteraceae bacterium]